MNRPADEKFLKSSFFRYRSTLLIFFLGLALSAVFFIQTRELEQSGIRLGFPNSVWALVMGLLLTWVVALYIYSTENRRLKRYYEHLSYVDPLTGLYNLRGFKMLADQQIRHARRHKKGFYLVLLDMDGLKGINDEFGHLEGDLLIKEAAKVLGASFRESDIISRIGGDEFVVLVLEHPLEDHRLVASRFRDRMGRTQTGRTSLYVSFSMGVTFFDPEHPLSLEELMSEADRAMYEEKRGKKSKILAFR